MNVIIRASLISRVATKAIAKTIIRLANLLSKVLSHQGGKSFIKCLEQIFINKIDIPPKRGFIFTDEIISSIISK